MSTVSDGYDIPNSGRRRFILSAVATAMLCYLGRSRVAFADEVKLLAAPDTPIFNDSVNAIEKIILQVSHDVWNTPELSHQEEKSSKIHKDVLVNNGFTITSTGTSGIPTAFVAEWSQGEGGPIIGYLPEYDALPGLKNAAEPRQDSQDTTNSSPGHGCGHNMLGASCTGAAIALRNIMLKENLNGKIRVYGCAAEETEGAKVYMARDGLFNDLDACLAWHPAPMTATGLLKTSAVNMLRIRYHGQTAHAGISPWEGRSALKGAELFGIGIQFIREQLTPTTRLHYVYTHSGETPNVIPDFAEVIIMVRGVNRQEVESVTKIVQDIAKGAALQSQTREEIELFFGMHDLLPNEALSRRILQHISTLPHEWSDEEQQFAKQCQREMKLNETGLMTHALPFLPEMTTGGSTDVGDVSYNAPVGIFAWTTMPVDVGLHTWPVTACGGMSIGDKATLNAAKVLTGVGYDIITNADFRAQVKADFEKRKGSYQYQSPLPEGRKRPDGIPAHLLLRDGTGELTDELYMLKELNIKV